MKTLFIVGSLLLAVVAFMGCAQIESDPVAVATQFHYTATGDDDYAGQATHAEIRMAQTSDSLISNWSDCRIVVDTIPWPPDVMDTLQVFLLAETEVVYYFAIKLADEIPNWSGVSNIITRTFPDNIPPATVGDFGFAD